MLYGISHGFDITHDLLVMDWHFHYILRLVVLLFYMSYTYPIEYILYTYHGQDCTSII